MRRSTQLIGKHVLLCVCLFGSMSNVSADKQFTLSSPDIQEQGRLSPGGTTHSYTITLYALNAPPQELGSTDNPAVDWADVMDAIEGKVIASSALTFLN